MVPDHMSDGFPNQFISEEFSGNISYWIGALCRLQNIIGQELRKVLEEAREDETVLTSLSTELEHARANSSRLHNQLATAMNSTNHENGYCAENATVCFSSPNRICQACNENQMSCFQYNEEIPIWNPYFLKFASLVAAFMSAMHYVALVRFLDSEFVACVKLSIRKASRVYSGKSGKQERQADDDNGRLQRSRYRNSAAG